ncbi:MAG: glycosyltransferase [Candidatus Latescibacterota bacterium]|nr:MAG: glycosyltransferase [Candidatus Latescibacterota bacterium]
MRQPKLQDYEPILGPRALDEMRFLAQPLADTRVCMVNSTAVGGGVAEILNRMIPLFIDVGVETNWRVIKGGNDFYEVTKQMHNALHGQPFEAPAGAFDILLEYNRRNAAELDIDEELVVIHDPQPVALIESRKPDSHWTWRCHIDVSNPNPEVWDFLKPWVERYEAALLSTPAFARQLSIPQYQVFPSIDPLADKNRQLEPEFIHDVLWKLGIPRDKPIVTQVSRFDRLKDPLGVVRAFRMARRHVDCRLVLVGGGADDDPEGAQVLAEVQEAAHGDSDIHVLVLPPTSHLEINALQRASDVVLQKSLREGFALTVAEALWKGKPVVASAVGGIPEQVLHGFTGMLVHSVEGAAYQIRNLLTNPGLARRLGECGHDRVRDEFLITRHLKRYLLLFLALSNAEHPEVQVVHAGN